jgi:hypothetical protein
MVSLSRFRKFYSCFFLISIIVPKIIILGPPASGRHTIGKLLQKKLNTVLIEPEEILRDIPNKFKSKLPTNPNIVGEFDMKLKEKERKIFFRIIFQYHYGWNCLMNV